MKNNDDYCLQNMRPDVAPPDDNAILGNIRIDNYAFTAHIELNHTPCHNTLIVSTNYLPLARLDVGGKCKDYSSNIGDILVYPAGIKQFASWDQENTYAVVTIESNFFKHIAYEHNNPDRIDLLASPPQPDPLIFSITQIINAQAQHRSLISLEYIDQVTTVLATHLQKSYCSTVFKPPDDSHVLSWKQLQLLYRYIENNLEETIPLQDLANLVGVSLYYFIRLFRRSTGETPAQYIMSRRLKRAIYLLNTTDLEIGMIARQVGFYDHSHLCRSFRKQLSTTPDQYRNN
jgi:AraC family transcriptional regulator